MITGKISGFDSVQNTPPYFLTSSVFLDTLIPQEPKNDARNDDL